MSRGGSRVGTEREVFDGRSRGTGRSSGKAYRWGSVCGSLRGKGSVAGHHGDSSHACRVLGNRELDEPSTERKWERERFRSACRARDSDKKRSRSRDIERRGGTRARGRKDVGFGILSGARGARGVGGRTFISTHTDDVIVHGAVRVSGNIWRDSGSGGEIGL